MRENVADRGGGVGELAESTHLTEHELQGGSNENNLL